MVKLIISVIDLKTMMQDNVLCFFGGYIIEHAKISKYGYDGKECAEDTFYYFECDVELAKVMYNAIVASYVAGQIFEFTRELSWKLTKKGVEENG